MKILFIHQNFPGQFKHLGPALVARGHEVTAFAMRPELGNLWNNIRICQYQPQRSSTPQIHPWLVDFETKVIRAEAVHQLAQRLETQGYRPDVIIAHPGWGESLFIKDIWPHAKIGVYCEFYYLRNGADIDFDPEFPSADATENCRLQIKNLNNAIHFEFADAGISPTIWQADTFPQPFRQKINVIHDGIDTKGLIPNPSIRLDFNDGSGRLDKNSEVITYVARNLEPYRGFHIFMRTLPEILQRRPKAHILIIGNDNVSYGAAPSNGQSWKQLLIDQISLVINPADWQRIHFLGNLPYQDFVGILQLSSVHVYLTYPFVLSWSLLEAMSCGCAIVASNTPPLQEMINHQENGLLTDFFDTAALAENICTLLDNPAQRYYLGDNARRLVCERYDLQSVCLPQQLAWIENLL